jgi:DNA-binding transcriptional ArsR family regulator
MEVAVTATPEPALALPPPLPPPGPASPLAPPAEPASALPPPENSGAIMFAARPSLIRAMNEQLLLEHIRQRGSCSRAELARVSGLSKPTVSLALDNVERAGLVRIAGQRTGVPGRAATA